MGVCPLNPYSSTAACALTSAPSSMRSGATSAFPYSAATCSKDAPTSGVNAETMLVLCSSSDGVARIAEASP